MQAPTLNIVGCGRLGRSLGRLWAEGGVFRIGDLYSRSEAAACSARDFIGAGRVVPGLAGLGPADAWMLSTPDGAIGDAAQALAAAGVVPPGACVFHCSGALGSDALAPLAPHVARAASAHPVRSFASPNDACAGFAGTHVGVEGDPGAVALLRDAFAAIGAHCFAIDPRHKLLYHAAAVFASNFSVVLLDVAQRAYHAAGLDSATATAVMRPLVEGAIGNALRLGPGAALSGPAARGDLDTVTRQQACVARWDAEAGQAYAVLSRLARDLAARR